MTVGVCVYVVLTYRLSVYMERVPTEGASGNMYVMLVGCRGDTGRRRLLHPLSAADSVCHSWLSVI